MKTPVWTKPVATGAVIGAIATAIIGFSWGGWVTSSSAGKMAASQSRAEVVSALLPVCVANAQADPAVEATLAAIRKADSYARDDMLMKTGWATMPGAERPDRQLATACRRSLLDES
ncbi:MAG: hypothetical protein VYB54_07185 [Pseudomonadota bacterium]|nr:hypothetical protein [Pseudomonadota bacterium]